MYSNDQITFWTNVIASIAALQFHCAAIPSISCMPDTGLCQTFTKKIESFWVSGGLFQLRIWRSFWNLKRFQTCKIGATFTLRTETVQTACARHVASVKIPRLELESKDPSLPLSVTQPIACKHASCPGGRWGNQNGAPFLKEISKSSQVRSCCYLVHLKVAEERNEPNCHPKALW